MPLALTLPVEGVSRDAERTALHSVRFNVSCVFLPLWRQPILFHHFIVTPVYLHTCVYASMPPHSAAAGGRGDETAWGPEPGLLGPPLVEQ